MLDVQSSSEPQVPPRPLQPASKFLGCDQEHRFALEEGELSFWDPFRKHATSLAQDPADDVHWPERLEQRPC